MSHREAARARQDQLTKPAGALGRLEALAIDLAGLQHTDRPHAARVPIVIFAGDHGVAAKGVSAYPQEVTIAMMANFAAGGAAISVLARELGSTLEVVDAGTLAETPMPGIVTDKPRRGSRDFSTDVALDASDIAFALDCGRRAVDRGAASAPDILIFGEMGIGNTTSAALLMHRLAPVPLADCVGAGAGLDAAGIARKLAVAERAASRSDATSPLDVLAEFGGYEIAMMAGAVLGSAGRRRPVIIDGFIATVAALVAVRLQPAARGYCVFSHRSAERGHSLLLEVLDAKPYLDLGLRLGEGTGAVMAVPLLRAAAGILTGIADLSDVLAGTLETPAADRQHG
jgi:nicotinate-nucleotide--dimethylbenzimidazole phosphoribosyltransferase